MGEGFNVEEEERKRRLRQVEKQDGEIRGVFMRGAQQQEGGGWLL